MWITEGGKGGRGALWGCARAFVHVCAAIFMLHAVEAKAGKCSTAGLPQGKGAEGGSAGVQRRGPPAGRGGRGRQRGSALLSAGGLFAQYRVQPRNVAPASCHPLFAFSDATTCLAVREEIRWCDGDGCGCSPLQDRPSASHAGLKQACKAAVQAEGRRLCPCPRPQTTHTCAPLPLPHLSHAQHTAHHVRDASTATLAAPHNTQHATHCTLHSPYISHCPA